jgi:Lecithin retinol acyltransferase
LLKKELKESSSFEARYILKRSASRGKMAKQEMRRGDHIYVKTKIPRVTHHGIYCGNGFAIHFDGHTKSITKSSLEDFAKPFETSCIKIYGYSHPLRFLNCLKIFSFPESRSSSQDTVIERAESLLGKSQYDLGRRNCEHFAVWCKTKKWESPQINKALGDFVRLAIQVSLALAVIPYPTSMAVGLVLVAVFGFPLWYGLQRASKPPKD